MFATHLDLITADLLCSLKKDNCICAGQLSARDSQNMGTGKPKPTLLVYDTECPIRDSYIMFDRCSPLVG